MSNYLVLSWRQDDALAEKTARRIIGSLSATSPSYITTVERPGFLIAHRRSAIRTVSHDSVVIGDLFEGARLDAGAQEAIGDGARAFESYCRFLVQKRWGSYIAVRQDPHDRGALSIFRDPMGMRECATWTHDGVRLVASQPVLWITQFPPKDMTIDWHRVANIAASPGAVTESLPLTGIQTVEPGTLIHLRGEDFTAERLWEPRQFCLRAKATASDPGALMQIADNCVAAWTRGHGASLLELSGGLDSAIVGASLKACNADLRRGYTFYSDDLAGDERRFSRPTVDQLAIACTEIAMEPRAITADDINSLPVDVRPSIGSTSLFHDRTLAQRAADDRAATLFTGRGGDALFFQHPTAAIAAESWPGATADKWDAMESIAQWSQTSVWTVLRYALFKGDLRRARAAATNPFVRHVHKARSAYWAGDLNGLPPAKRMQVTALAGDRAAFAPSWCSDVMTVIHPLLSQPLVEYALGLSTLVLTQGRRDRALARAAFAHRLPQTLIRRRGKGSLSCFFGRSLAMSVPFLRDRLLGGALAQAGILDLPALERALDRDRLMQVDCYTELLSLLLLEQWARTWVSRLALMR
ncbi:MAG: asparagine synthase-related protein [Sphingobium sp.]